MQFLRYIPITCPHRHVQGVAFLLEDVSCQEISGTAKNLQLASPNPYIMIKFEPGLGENYGIFMKVKRASFSKWFAIHIATDSPWTSTSDARM
jgi:hypothetical protein